MLNIEKVFYFLVGFCSFGSERFFWNCWNEFVYTEGLRREVRMNLDFCNGRKLVRATSRVEDGTG